MPRRSDMWRTIRVRAGSGYNSCLSRRHDHRSSPLGINIVATTAGILLTMQVRHLIRYLNLLRHNIYLLVSKNSEQKEYYGN